MREALAAAESGCTLLISCFLEVVSKATCMIMDCRCFFEYDVNICRGGRVGDGRLTCGFALDVLRSGLRTVMVIVPILTWHLDECTFGLCPL